MMVQRSFAALQDISSQHPGAILLRSKRAEIRRNRFELLRQVRAVSPPLGRFVCKALSDRDGLDPPPIGEVWPWLLADLAGLPEETVADVARAWLAVYVYTLLIDRACDEPERPTPEATLAGALLFEVGLGDFLSITAGTPWQRTVRESARLALGHQFRDVTLPDSGISADARRISSAGKNTGFLICTAAFAALGVCDATALERFTRSLLLALQHLDDIADFETDWARRNTTPFLRFRQEWLPEKAAPVSRFDLLEALVVSGALERVLIDVRDAIRGQLPLIRRSYGPREATSSWSFLMSLLEALDTALDTVGEAAAVIAVSQHHRTTTMGILTKVDHSLRIVAQQS